MCLSVQEILCMREAFPFKPSQSSGPSVKESQSYRPPVNALDYGQNSGP